MYFSLGSLSIPPVGMAGLVFLSLIWPTFWMGVSLPVLGRAVARSLEGAPRHVGLLYGLNTLGAATGAFATTWMLFPALGLAGSLQFAAALNALAAVAAGLMAALDRHEARIPTPALTDDGRVVTGKGVSSRPDTGGARVAVHGLGGVFTPSPDSRPSRWKSCGSGCSG